MRKPEPSNATREAAAFQADVDGVSAPDYNAFRAAGASMPEKARRAAFAAHPGLRRYDEAIEKVFAEARATDVSPGAPPAVWIVYNMGLVVKTPRALFGIDIAHRQGARPTSGSSIRAAGSTSRRASARSVRAASRSATSASWATRRSAGAGRSPTAAPRPTGPSPPAPKPSFPSGANACNDPAAMRRTLLLPLLALAAAPALAARPVARWDVVPDQRVSGTFLAGVCAFHEDGVRVAFSLNGRFVHVAKEPKKNPRTGVWEYVFPLDAVKLPDGPVTLGARARSGGEKPEDYDLPPLMIYANNGGSLTVAETVWVDAARGDDAAAGTEKAPLRSIAAAVKRAPVGGTILLKPGEYAAGGLKGGSDRPYWTTIAAAPGVAREAVQIAGGRPGTQRLRFRGVTLYCDVKGRYGSILDGENGKHAVWLDDCKAYNRQGRWAANANVFGNRYVAYVTGGLTTELCNGPDGVLLRGHEVRRIASDVWTGSDRLVVNCTASDVDGGDTGAHPDFHQSHAKPPGWVHDVILYNVTGYNCKCQGLFGLRLRDSAFVNVVFERTKESDFLTQYSGPMENVLFAHVTLVNQVWLWRDDYAPADVRVVNCCVPSMGTHKSERAFDGSGANGLLVSRCFFYGKKSAPFGLDAKTGDPRFANPAARDYSLRPGSPALANFRPLQCVPADFRGVPFRGASAAAPNRPRAIPNRSRP